MSESLGVPPSTHELRLLKSDLLSEERLLEILDLAAADPELQGQLLAAQPLAQDELLAAGARVRAAAAAVDASFGTHSVPLIRRLHAVIEVPWSEVAERLQRFFASPAGPQLAPSWGVRSARRGLTPGEEERIPILREVREVDGAPAEIAADLVRRAEQGPGATAILLKRFVHVSVFDSEADRGLEGLTVVLTTPFHTTAVSTTNSDGVTVFPIAIGGNWLFDRPSPLEGVVRIEIGDSD